MQLSSPVETRGQRVQSEYVRLISLLMQVIVTVAMHKSLCPKVTVGWGESDLAD
jgi:hypothetical protein